MGVKLVDENGREIGGDTFRVFPEHRTAEQLFYCAATQWKRNPMTGDLQALNYPGVESAARLAALEVTPDTFHQLQFIERGALGIMPDLSELDELDIVSLDFPDGETVPHGHSDHR